MRWTAFRVGKAARKRLQLQIGRQPRLPDQPPSSASDDADYWMSVFGHLDSTPEIKEALTPSPTLLTDEEIARIQREVDQES